MADDYRTIANTETNPISPIVAALMKALEQNPRAIAAGSPSAPAVRAGWHPHGILNVGEGQGVLYDFSVDGGVNSVTSPDFLDGFDYRLIALGLSHNGASAEMNLQVQRQDNSAWVQLALIAASSSVTLSDSWEFVLPRATDRYKLVAPSAGASLDMGAATKIKAIRIINDVAVDFDSGRVILQKRLSYE